MYSRAVEDELWNTLRARRARSTVQRSQDGAAALIPPFDVLRIYRERFGDDGSDLVLFGGTVPLLDGQFRYGSDWTVRLTLGHETSHTQLPDRHGAGASVRRRDAETLRMNSSRSQTWKWMPCEGKVPDLTERILARDSEHGVVSRMLRFAAGTDTSPNGALRPRLLGRGLYRLGGIDDGPSVG